MNRSHYIALIGRAKKMLLLFFVPLVFAPNIAAAETSCLSIYSYTFNELTKVCAEISKIGEISVPAGDVESFDRALRSPDGAKTEMDPRLLELFFKISRHFAVESFELISGYRSPEYNAGLKQDGRGVADASVHTQGYAADIHLNEISEVELWKFVKKSGLGGAGIYPCFNFVHIDVSRPRFWSENCGERKLVGEGAIAFVTGSNSYVSSKHFSRRNLVKKLKFEPKLPASAVLERFTEGKWREEENEELPFGKYRFVACNGRSNEFYLRKK